MFKCIFVCYVIYRLVITKPWVVEAFNFLAASVHQESGQGSRRNDAGSGLFSASMFAEDEDMDDGEGFEEAAGGSTSRITREQLSAALNSLNAIGNFSLLQNLAS